DAPAPVARARPAVADRDALAIDRQPARPAPVLRHARVVHEHSRAVAADEAWLLDRKMASGKGQLAGKRTIAGRDPERQNLKRRVDIDRDRADAEIETLAC